MRPFYCGSVLQRQDKVIAAEYYFHEQDVSGCACRLSQYFCAPCKAEKLACRQVRIVPTSNVGKVSDEKVKTVLGNLTSRPNPKRVSAFKADYISRETPLANGARFDLG